MSVTFVIVETMVCAAAISTIAYGIIWLTYYYFKELPILRYDNRLHKQVYRIGGNSNMTKDKMYDYIIGPKTTPEPAAPAEPRETYTREEVDRLIEEKTRELLESIKANNEPSVSDENGPKTTETEKAEE